MISYFTEELMVRISLAPAAFARLRRNSAPVCQGAKVKVWDQHAPSHYEKAQFQQAVVSSEGVIRLGRRLKPFADLDAAHVWDLVEVKDGVLFAAAGDEGKVYKISSDGKSSIVYADDQSRPFCLAAAGDDAVYVGAGPHGQILRVDVNGKVKVVCDTGEPYVWSMAVDPNRERSTPARGRMAASTKSVPKERARFSMQRSKITSCAWRRSRRQRLCRSG